MSSPQGDYDDQSSVGPAREVNHGLCSGGRRRHGGGPPGTGDAALQECWLSGLVGAGTVAFDEMLR